jgi:hypothetical protein
MSELGKKFRENQDWEEQVDGSTIEKRRDQRAEILEEYLGGLTEDDRQGVLGKVNQYTKATGVNVVPASASVFDPKSKTKQLRGFEASKVFKEEDLPPIVKRTPQERIESMVKRLMNAHPAEIEFILQDLQYEYWKAGAPVTVDALRTVATHFLNRAERKRN